MKRRRWEPTPYLWVRHATLANAVGSGANIATANPDLIVFVADDPTVPMFPHAVTSVPATTPEGA